MELMRSATVGEGPSPPSAAKPGDAHPDVKASPLMAMTFETVARHLMYFRMLSSRVEQTDSDQFKRASEH